MSELMLQQCCELSAGDSALTMDEAHSLLPQLDPRWQLDTKNRSIGHTYHFKDYYQTMAFVNVIAQVAHQQNHHPEMHVSYKQCSITYSTHSVDGLSLNDFICAAKINAAQTL